MLLKTILHLWNGGHCTSTLTFITMMLSIVFIPMLQPWQVWLLPFWWFIPKMEESSEFPQIYKLCPVWEKLTEYLAGNPWEETSPHPPLVLDHAPHCSWVRGILSAPWWSQCASRHHRNLQRYRDSSSPFHIYVTNEELPLSITITDCPFERLCPHIYFLRLRSSLCS